MFFFGDPHLSVKTKHNYYAVFCLCRCSTALWIWPVLLRDEDSVDSFHQDGCISTKMGVLVPRWVY